MLASLGVTLFGAVLAAPATTDRAVDARWTSSTIPAIGVHLIDAEGGVVSDARVVLRGPGGERLEGHTDRAGSVTRVFLPIGYWRVSVYGADGPTHDLWVELTPRQRADLELVVQSDTLHAPDDPVKVPVIAVDEAVRGSRTNGGSMRRAPL